MREPYGPGPPAAPPMRQHRTHLVNSFPPARVTTPRRVLAERRPASTRWEPATSEWLSVNGNMPTTALTTVEEVRRSVNPMMCWLRREEYPAGCSILDRGRMG